MDLRVVREDFIFQSRVVSERFAIDTLGVGLLSGSFAMTGTNAALVYSLYKSIGMELATFVQTGQNANLTVAYKMAMATGSFAMTGNAAGLGKTYLMTASSGSFSMTGQNAILTFTGAQYTVSSTLVQESAGAQTFVSTLSSSGGTKVLSVTGQGSSDSGVLAYGTGIVNVTVSKTTNGGLCIDIAQVTFKKNGTAVYSPTFTNGQDMSNITYSYTSLSPGDALTIEITEGAV